MIIAINYANELFIKSQKLNRKTALKWGADKVYCYGPQDIDKEFYEKNKEILEAKRGNGFFLWKPYFIKRTLDDAAVGDYIIYADSGCIYENKIQYLISSMEKENMDIMIFSLEIERKERYYTKRDALIIMNCDNEEYLDTPQSCATYILIKKSDFTLRYVDEWLRYAEDVRVISGYDNVMGYDNYNGYIEHRHDQSILSLLSKKYKLKRFRDPSQYGINGKYEREVEERSDYPKIFDSHRMPDCGTMLKLRIKENKYVKMYEYKKYLRKVKKANASS